MQHLWKKPFDIMCFRPVHSVEDPGIQQEPEGIVPGLSGCRMSRKGEVQDPAIRPQGRPASACLDDISRRHEGASSLALAGVVRGRPRGRGMPCPGEPSGTRDPRRLAFLALPFVQWAPESWSMHTRHRGEETK
jgi:hypothetical protein